MFHAAVTGRPCYNLDPVLTSEEYIRHSYAKRCAKAECGVVEGVMGLFDGATGVDDTASTAHIARLLNLPVLLVVDCGRMSRSLAALVRGYKTFDSRINVAGAVLNRVGSDRHLELLSEALNAIDMPIFGVFRRERDIQLPSRHLGLIPTEEVNEFDQIADRLADLGEKCFDWHQLEKLLAVGDIQPVEKRVVKGEKVKIAIARDSAFNFYYPDNLEALEAQGAELIYWSPIEDISLPAADGLYFGGGFPEVFAAELSENKSMLNAVRQAIEKGLPTYAECGGLMYLSSVLTDFAGRDWGMVGAIAQTIRMEKRLTLGYRQATALKDGPLLEKGQSVIGHEFHKSCVIRGGKEVMEKQAAYRTKRFWGGADNSQTEGSLTQTLHASYVHQNWSHRPDIAQRFIQHCANYRSNRTTF